MGVRAEGGDPERSMELLWGPRDPHTRRGLTLDRIVRAAVDVADAEGLDALSMRRVAERLGFTTMALYRHVPGKAELIGLMLDAVAGKTPADDTEAGDWRGRLAAWARAGRESYVRHPWAALTTAFRTVPGPNTVAYEEAGLRALADTGLTPAEMVAAMELVWGFVGSTARAEAERADRERRTGIGDDEWWEARESLWSRMPRYPTITRVYEMGGYDHPEDPFEFGLRRVLDGIEALIRERVRIDSRDEMRDEMRDVMACAVCGRRLDSAGRGRRRTYCSRSCRQRAYRARASRRA